MTTLVERIRAARERGQIDELAGAIPYARFMGISMRLEGAVVIGHLAASDHLIGNARLDHLHGGTTGALLESTAIAQLCWREQVEALPKVINLTIQFLRSGKPRDTYARAELTRLGRRVANVHAQAWQDDPQAPIATATAHLLLR